MVKYIDMTPTWGAVVPWITTGLEAGGTAHSNALQEMYRMADAADKWNANAAGMRWETCNLDAEQAAALMDEVCDMARAAIAKAKGN